MINQNNHKIDIILQNFNRLRDTLISNNSTNAANLHISNINFTSLFNYSKTAISCILKKISRLRHRLSIYKQIIIKNNLSHLLQPQQQSDNQELKQKNAQMIYEINKQNSKIITGNNKRKKTKSQYLQPSEKHEKLINKKITNLRNKYQYGLVQNFVNTQLCPKLVQDQKSSLGKALVMNLFIKWNKENNYELHGPDSYLQMYMTHSLKNKYYGLQHNHRYYKRLKLAPQYEYLNQYTDDILKNRLKNQDQILQQSPPLPIFDDDHLAQ